MPQLNLIAEKICLFLACLVPEISGPKVGLTFYQNQQKVSFDKSFEAFYINVSLIFDPQCSKFLDLFNPRI